MSLLSVSKTKNRHGQKRLELSCMVQIKVNKPITQSEKAYHILKKMIICGDLSEGDAISILSLSEQLGIGRTPITAACQHLEYYGLVRIIPKQGVWVNTISIEEAREIYEARAAIETFFIRKAMSSLTQADIEALSASIERQLQLGEEANYHEYMAEDTYFHSYCMSKYPNKTLAQMYDQLLARISLCGIKNASKELTRKSRLEAAIQDHREIIRCIQRKDIEAAGQAMTQHITSGYLKLTGTL